MAGRLLGVDLGRKRIGLAVSDVSGTLARPLTTLHLGGGDPVEHVLREIARLSAEEGALAGVVVGVPLRLDGSPGEGTGPARQFIERLRARASVPVMEEDERLTSREAESRLALRERDWRRRKARLDAAAAAVILQDYLDRRAPRGDRREGPAGDAAGGAAPHND
jgi:putative Holliday junction resolvase